MKRYTIDVGDKRFVVDVQDTGEDTYRVMVGDRWFDVHASQGREVGQDWDIVERQSIAPIMPTINITMPEQPAPIIPAPVVNVTMPKQERQAAPIVNVNVPQQPAPDVVVNVPPANVSIPDINLRAGSVAKVKRDYTGKIMEITSNASVEGNA